jgi:TonB family protein
MEDAVPSRRPLAVPRELHVERWDNSTSWLAREACGDMVLSDNTLPVVGAHANVGAKKRPAISRRRPVMKRSRIIVRVLPFLFVLAVCAAAQPQTEPRALMRELADKYKASTYYLDYTIVSHTKTESFRSTTELKVEQSFVLAGNKAVLPGNGAARSLAEIGSPVGPLTIVCDGKTNWTLAPQLKQFTKKVLGASSEKKGPSELADIGAAIGGLDMASIFATQANSFLTEMIAIGDRIKDAKYLPEERMLFDGKNVDVLVIEVEYLSTKAGQSSHATFWVDKEKHLILREVSQQTGQSLFGESSTNTITTTFKRVQLNEPVSDDLFAFRPPADAKEVDQLDFMAASNGKGAGELTGKEAIDFTLKDLAGNDVSLQKLKGKVVVLDFWATWCAPCLVELPHIEKLHRDLKDSGVVFLGINDEAADTARDFMKSKGYTFASLVDTEKEVSGKYEIDVIPQTIVIDKTGKVSAHYFGTRNEDELWKGLAKAGVARPAKPSKPSGQASVSPAVGGEDGEKALSPMSFSEAQTINRVDAVYPPGLKGLSGTAQVLVTISAAGIVLDAEAISGPPMFQESAVNAARQWTFKPVLRNGKPVAAAIVLTFNFTPPGSQGSVPRGGEGQTQGPGGPYIAGLEEFKKGEYKQALELLIQVRQDDRNYKSAKYYIGLANSRLERYRDAAAAYRELIDLEPANLFAHYELAKAAFKFGDQKTTEEEQKILRDKSPELSQYLADYVSGTVTVPGDHAPAGNHAQAVDAGKNGTTRPAILHKEMAKYTDIGRQNLIQGTVVLRAIFTREGEIAEIKVVQSLPDGLTNRAIEAAQKIKFQPATKDGQPVDVRANLEFTFNLF